MTTSKTLKSAAAQAAETVKQPIEDAVAIQQETVETVVKAGSDGAGKNADKAVSLARDHVEAAARVGSDVFKGYEDLLQFGKDNLDALMSSANIVARGVQDLSQTVTVLAQETLEETVAVSKALVGARTLQEVIDLSSTLAQAHLDKLVAESSKLGQLSSKLAEEAIAPINKRFDVAVQKLTKTAA